MEKDDNINEEDDVLDDKLKTKSLRPKTKSNASFKANLFNLIRKPKRSQLDSTNNYKNEIGDYSQNLESTSSRCNDTGSVTSTVCSGEETYSHDALRLFNAIKGDRESGINQSYSNTIGVFDSKFFNLINEISKDFSAVRCDIKTNSDKLDILRNDVNLQLSDERIFFLNEITKLKNNIHTLEENSEILEYRLNERINELDDAYSSLNNLVRTLSKQQSQHQQLLSMVDKYLVIDESETGASNYILKYLIPVVIFVISMSITVWNKLTAHISPGASTVLILICVLIVAALFMFYF